MGSTFRKGSSQSGQSTGASQQQIDIAKRQVALAEKEAAITEPLRKRSADIGLGFLNTGQTPGFLDLPSTVSPLAPFARFSLPGMESEQAILRRQLVNQGSRGGLLQQQLAQAAVQGGTNRANLQQQFGIQDLLRQEQRDVARAQLRQTLYGGVADVGQGGLALAFQGLAGGQNALSSAASNLNQLGAQRIQQNMVAQQGIGQVLGKAIGAGAGYGLPAPGAGTLGAAKLGG